MAKDQKRPVDQSGIYKDGAQKADDDRKEMKSPEKKTKPKKHG